MAEDDCKKLARHYQGYIHVQVFISSMILLAISSHRQSSSTDDDVSKYICLTYFSCNIKQCLW